MNMLRSPARSRCTRRGAAALAALATIAILAAPTLAWGATTSATTAAPVPGSGSIHVVVPAITYLVLTYDGSTLKLFVNGRQSAARVAPGPADPGIRVTEIGGFLGRQSWQGALDEVALYRSVLSPGTIAAHYQLGTAHGAQYAPAVLRTPGIVDYWRFANPERLHDLVGHAHATASHRGVVPWHSLIVGTSNGAVGLGGLGGEIRIQNVPVLRRRLSIEAWALAGPTPGRRMIVARAGAWYLATDLFAHWTGGVFKGRHIIGVTSPLGARGGPTPTSAAPPTALASPDTSGGGSSPVLTLVLLMAIAALAAASIPLRRRHKAAVRSGEDGGAGRSDSERGSDGGAAGPGDAVEDGPSGARAPSVTASAWEDAGATRTVSVGQQAQVETNGDSGRPLSRRPRLRRWQSAVRRNARDPRR